jgi:hypothetical protein
MPLVEDEILLFLEGIATSELLVFRSSRGGL